jgi:hypothetical protein
MQPLSTQHQSGVVFSQTLVCCLLDTIRRRIPVSTTCGARTAQNPPPRRSTTSQPAVALAPLNCGAVPSLPSQSIGLSERTRAVHHAISGLRVPLCLLPLLLAQWPPPAASPRRSASPRCPAAAPLPASWPSPSAVVRSNTFAAARLAASRSSTLLLLLLVLTPAADH